MKVYVQYWFVVVVGLAGIYALPAVAVGANLIRDDDFIPTTGMEIGSGNGTLFAVIT